jgi:aspartate 1-decarboxylase
MLDIEYMGRKERNSTEYLRLAAKRRKLKRLFLSSLILNLKVNKTHPDCLQGSAELPANIMNKANIKKYQSVCVYNSSLGGVADTYAVPMPPKIVMTTGAMASFAVIGNIVNVATYIISNESRAPKIITTNGNTFLKRI